MKLSARLRTLLVCPRGTTTAEFVILLSLLCIACLAGWKMLGPIIISTISGD